MRTGKLESTGDLLPSASGAADVGTRQVAFASGIFDILYADHLYGDGSTLSGILTDSYYED